MRRHTFSSIFSSLWGSDSPALLASNKMLESAASGDLADFKRHLLELFKLMPNKVDALLVTDGGEWTALQLGAATGKKDVVVEILQAINTFDIFAEPVIEYKGVNNMSALVLALNNGHTAIAAELINAGASLHGTAPRERNCVFLISRGGHFDILSQAIQKQGPSAFKCLAEVNDSNGYTSLHVAALMGHADICAALLDLGLDPAAVTRDGSNAVHIACRNTKHADSDSSRATINTILQHCPGSAMTAADAFGSSPLHVALSCSNIQAVKSILSKFPISALLCQDNDGLHPTNVACQHLCSLLYQRNSESDENVLASLATKILDSVCSLQELVAAGYPLDQVDFSNYTVFHNLSSHPYEEVLQLFGLIIDAVNLSPHYASLSLQDVLEREAANGLTCLHNVYQNEGPCKGQLINLIRKHVSAQFLATFDETKAKGDTREYRNKCGAHNRIPLETRRRILNEDYTIESVANHLLNLNHTPRVVVLIGAGISTSAGIPDFRSNDGLYSNSATSNMFSVQFLQESPELFYGRIRDIFLPVVDKVIKPTRTHALLRVLKDAGWLSRVYTQNIDMLEYPMLAEEDVVECHGSFKAAYCLDPNCHMRLHTVPEMEESFWGPIRKGQSPKCKLCSNYIRPDVVFFGEPLPDRFNKFNFVDMSNCDLVLVMGTSLLVYPVASLPQMVSPHCLRLLINRDASGCFQGVAPKNISLSAGTAVPTQTIDSPAVQQYTTKSYRDVFFQGNCDEGAVNLANALGMSTQLETIANEYC